MATVVHTKSVRFVDEDVIEIKLSSLTAGADVTLDHGGPANAHVAFVECIPIEPATDDSNVQFVWKKAHDDTVNDHIIVNFNCAPGGSLDGAQVILLVHFTEAAGSLNPP